MSTMHRLLLGLLAVAVCKLAVATLVPEEEGLSIIYPSYARKNIYVAMANFGVPKYGGFLSGELVYVSSEGRYYQNETYRCYPRDCQYGCDLNTSRPASQPNAVPGLRIPKKSGSSYIMLVERGPKGDSACFFLDKIYNAQLAGADAVLVANYPGENLTTAIAPDTNDTAPERAQLTVSAGMISWEDAQFLKGLVANVTATAGAAGGGEAGGGGGVHLLLNWTRSLPQTMQVSWEFWTSSEDVCGGACSERTNFTAAIRSQAITFEQAALTKFTPRYFLYACKAGTNNDSACLNNCFSGGRYCGWPNINNYTGKDVLRMNLRAKCFFNQASANGNGYLWWDYVTRFATNCSIADKAYNAECAGKVFDSLASFPNSNKAAWEACSNVNEADPVIPILEDELQAQYGNYTDRTVAEVKINPTIRINGEQYRGSLESGPVLRALCAGFRSGYEPGVCNSPTISDDECAGPNGEGYVRCGVGSSGNRSRCINTFQGYQCACGSGFQLVFEPGDSFSEACDDINECLVSKAPMRVPNCSCQRCACVNLPGSYNCTGELPNLCDAASAFNGCWSGTFNGRTLSNCVDNIRDYQDRAARGLLKEGENWAKCGDCPKCFRPVSEPSLAGGVRCEPLCDLSLCDEYSGFCSAGGGSKDHGGKTGGDGGKGSSGGGGGVHLGVLVLVALGAAALTGVVVMAANQLMMRRRMGDEIREIMGAYMPLQEDRARSSPAAARRGVGGVGGGGGPPERERIIRPDEDSEEEDGRVGPYGWAAGRAPAAAAAAATPLGPLGDGGAAAAPALVGASQRAVWGPPAATSAAGGGPTFGSPIPLPASAAASAAPRPTVEAVPASASASAADADPLLGLSLVGSSSLEALGAAAPGAKGGKGPENPFL